MIREAEDDGQTGRLRQPGSEQLCRNEDNLVVWTDGSGSGLICYVVEDGRQDIRRLSEGSGNLAEFYAILHALSEIPNKNLTVVSDSQSAVAVLNRQVVGNAKITQPLQAKIFHRCRNRNVSFLWVPRNENTAGVVLERLLQSRFRMPQEMLRAYGREGFS